MGFQFQKKNGELGLALVVLVMILMVGLEAKCCRAAILVKSNATYECKSNGRLEDCRIEEDLELELDNFDFLTTWNVFRILQDGKDNHITGNTNNANQHLCQGLKGEPYDQCIAKLNGKKVPEHCSTYNKGCK
ncbi:hypothetical protein CCACVL1_04555 [Corchorus capsularis]|uniref:Rapid ALkalinization Factor n=1 Tax=Corchorus capsularis TaxID=210143 RepID=A0A1R3JRH0_COCAP|nr:hypothetical protein CCACVL1_04555 [Corchorus capsularis]